MKPRMLIVLLLVLAAAAAAGWGAMRLIRAAGEATPPETPNTRVKRGPVAITVSARGELQGGNPEMLIAPMVGSDSLNVTELRDTGDLVKEGDVVVRFDTTQQEYNLREAQADLAEAQQKVIQAESENAADDEETRYAVEAAKTTVRVAEIE